MAKCLVLGANGFIGSHLVDGLVDSGYEVRAFSRYRSSKTNFNSDGAIEIFQGDFLNKKDLEDAVNGVDYVFHFISTTTPATAEEDPFIDLETNVRQTVELLKLCTKANVKRVIYASSGGTVYGDSYDGTLHKETDQTRPVSPYGIGKVAIEDYLRYFRVKYGLPYTVFRIANPFGERQQFWRKQGVIPIFIKQVLDDKPVTVYGDGSMVRDYIYVKDMVNMILVTLNKEPRYDTYNIGSGIGFSVNEVIDAIETVSNKQVQRDVRDVPPTFVDKTVLDTTRYTKEFKIIPETSLLDGIKATYEYIKQENRERV